MVLLNQPGFGGRKVLAQTVTVFTSGTAVQIPVIVNFEAPLEYLEQINATSVIPAANAPVTAFGYKIDPIRENVLGLTLTVLTTGTTVTAQIIAVAQN
jgi:hypothetical protein